LIGVVMGHEEWERVKAELFHSFSVWLPKEFEVGQTLSGVDVIHIESGSSYTFSLDGIALQCTPPDPNDIWAAIFSALDGIQDFVMESTTFPWPNGSQAQPRIEVFDHGIEFGYQSNDDWVLVAKVVND
jgi:hypothetical protein